MGSAPSKIDQIRLLRLAQRHDLLPELRSILVLARSMITLSRSAKHSPEACASVAARAVGVACSVFEHVQPAFIQTNKVVIQRICALQCAYVILETVMQGFANSNRPGCSPGKSPMMESLLNGALEIESAYRNLQIAVATIVYSKSCRLVQRFEAPATQMKMLTWNEIELVKSASTSDLGSDTFHAVYSISKEPKRLLVVRQYVPSSSRKDAFFRDLDSLQKLRHRNISPILGSSSSSSSCYFIAFEAGASIPLPQFLAHICTADTMTAQIAVLNLMFDLREALKVASDHGIITTRNDASRLMESGGITIKPGGCAVIALRSGESRRYTGKPYEPEYGYGRDLYRCWHLLGLRSFRKLRGLDASLCADWEASEKMITGHVRHGAPSPLLLRLPSTPADRQLHCDGYGGAMSSRKIGDIIYACKTALGPQFVHHGNVLPKLPPVEVVITWYDATTGRKVPSTSLNCTQVSEAITRFSFSEDLSGAHFVCSYHFAPSREVWHLLQEYAANVATRSLVNHWEVRLVGATVRIANVELGSGMHYVYMHTIAGELVHCYASASSQPLCSSELDNTLLYGDERLTESRTVYFAELEKDDTPLSICKEELQDLLLVSNPNEITAVCALNNPSEEWSFHALLRLALYLCVFLHWVATNLTRILHCILRCMLDSL